MQSYFLLTIAAACLILLLGLKITRSLGILDKPGKDVPARERVPTVQGVILLLGFFAIGYVLFPEYFVWSSQNPFLGLYVGGGLVALMSLYDELGYLIYPRFRIAPAIRLVIQIIAVVAAFMISGVGITEFQLPGGTLLLFPTWLAIALTVGWFLVFINAINWFDGVYGLASGSASIGFLTIFLLLALVVFPYYPEMSGAKTELLQSVQVYAWILFSLSAIASIIEWKPFGLLRDVGTMFLGFALAYLALLGGAKIGTIIVVLALPLFDAIWVIVDRMVRRKTHPFKGDYSHLQYRLMALGRSRDEVRTTILSVTGVLMILMLLQGSDRIGKIIIFVLMAVIFFGVNRYLFWKKGLPSTYTPKID